MFISDGQIVEHGSHDELMAKKGRYHDLYQAQYIVGNLQENALLKG